MGWKVGAWRTGAWVGTAWETSNSVVAETGSYQLTGKDVGLYRGWSMVADSGSYTITGNAVNFPKTFVVQPDSGQYNLAGTSSILQFFTIPPTIKPEARRIAISKLKIGL